MLDFKKSPPSDRTILIISIIIKIFHGLQVKPLQLMLKVKKKNSLEYEGSEEIQNYF